MASEFGRVGKVKYPGVGKKTHSVFEGLFSFPIRISNPNFAKCRRSRGVPVSNWCIDSKTKAPSSTQSMQKSSKSAPRLKDRGGWLMSWPSDKGESLLRENFALVSPLSFHYFSSVSENAITMKRNRTGATLSPCLTPTLKYIVVSNSPTTNLTTLSLYILVMVSHRFGGQLYVNIKG